jgi:hypothetical protein
MTIVLAVIGIGWQFRNIEKWAQSHPMFGGVSAAARGNRTGPTMT